jgi:hypothetical protein
MTDRGSSLFGLLVSQALRQRALFPCAVTPVFRIVDNGGVPRDKLQDHEPALQAVTMPAPLRVEWPMPPYAARFTGHGLYFEKS